MAWPCQKVSLLGQDVPVNTSFCQGQHAVKAQGVNGRIMSHDRAEQWLLVDEVLRKLLDLVCTAQGTLR